MNELKSIFCFQFLLGISVRESYRPEGNIEDQEYQNVQNLAESIYPVSLHPSRLPVRIFSEEIYLIILRIFLGFLQTGIKSTSNIDKG